jgi:hypothetical protein
MNNRFRYQLVLLGSNELLKDIIEEKFKDSIRTLRMSIESFSIIRGKDFQAVFKMNLPVFTIYLGNRDGKFEDLNFLDIIIKKGNMILPVFYDQIEAEIPEKLRDYNGQKFSGKEVERIVNLALEAFGKLRNTRKVFISYRRSESSSVAIQLYEALEKYNFDVFLDTHSIKQGEPFQDELWHRMTDSDVIVLLNTKEFLDSRWCKEEIAEANAKKIGVIQLVWPSHKLGSTNEICTPIFLKETDFIDGIFDDKDRSKLVVSLVEDIVRSVESQRARNLASRQDGIILEFLESARKQGKKMCLQPERFITEELGKNKRRIFVPAIGIPQSIDCHQTDEIKEEIREYNVDEIHLIYDDLRIRQKWLKHLDWLNGYLKTQTIKKQEFDTWLQKN